MPSLFKIASTIALVTAYAHIASTAPAPSPQFTEAGDAYSGEGGTANGGSVMKATDPSDKGLLGGLTVLKAFSDNAGAGGKANSGVALTGPINSTVTNNGINDVASSSGGTNVLGSAYTGKGGSASGGNVAGTESDGLVDLFTGNAGKGGDAASGGSGSNLVPVSPPQSKVGGAPKAPISQPLRLLPIIRARMDMD